MKVDISKARLHRMADPVVWIEGYGQGFSLGLSNGIQCEYGNVREICIDCNIDPMRLRAAVEFEGYEIDGLTTRLIRFPGMDAEGVIQSKDMKSEYRMKVRDWQVCQDLEDDWWGDWKGSGSAEFWRPASYGRAEAITGAEYGDIVDAAEARLGGADALGVSASLLGPEECDKRDGYLHPTDACDDEPVERTSEGQIGLKREWPVALNLSEADAQQFARDLQRASENGCLDECAEPAAEETEGNPVERTNEGRVDPEGLQEFKARGMSPAECAEQRQRLAGNPFETIALDLARLVTDKQRQYGDSVGRTGAILRILYPEGIPPDALDRALLITRCLDKFSRLATHKQDLGGENPWRDVAGYALLAMEKGF